MDEDPKKKIAIITLIGSIIGLSLFGGVSLFNINVNVNLNQPVSSSITERLSSDLNASKIEVTKDYNTDLKSQSSNNTDSTNVEVNQKENIYLGDCIEVNTSYDGTTMSSNDSHWYQLEIIEDSLVSLEFENKNVLELGNPMWYVYLGTSDSVVINFSIALSQKLKISQDTELHKGTYYLLVYPLLYVKDKNNGYTFNIRSKPIVNESKKNENLKLEKQKTNNKVDDFLVNLRNEDKQKFNFLIDTIIAICIIVMSLLCMVLIKLIKLSVKHIDTVLNIAIVLLFVLFFIYIGKLSFIIFLLHYKLTV